MKDGSRVEAVGDVVATSLKGSKKMHIMNNTNLNFRTINSYFKIAGQDKNFLVVLREYKLHMSKAEKTQQLVKDKKDLLERMCTRVDVCGELSKSDERIAVEQKIV